MNGNDSDLNKRLLRAISDLDLNNNSQRFIEPTDVQPLLRQMDLLVDDSKKRQKKLLYKLGFVNRDLKSNIVRFQKLYSSYPSDVNRHNTELAVANGRVIGESINPVEGHMLDEQQLTSIAYDIRTRLVIAGAGSGKTTTLVGLVKHLLQSGKAKPNEILLLSFTNASVDELRQRILKETDWDIEVSTFHRLGMKIIKESTNKVPKVSKTELTDFIIEEINRRKSDMVFISKLNDYVTYGYQTALDENQFSDNWQMKRYLLENPLITLNRETVKSFGECDIANYLVTHGIPYSYEESYKVDTNTSEYGQYHPDFHIRDTDIYIEYFGIDRKGNVAKFMIDENPNAAEDYREGIEWKRRIHEENGTHLIELYAYDRSEGRLLEELERKLEPFHLDYEPCSPDEIFDRSFANDERKLRILAQSFATSIILIKSFGKPWEEVFPKENNDALRKLEGILKLLYDAYQEHLRKENEIDFEDMLNIASENVLNRRFIHPYRYVIVDEYQDISRSRFNLLKSMRRTRDFKLFCVGDDWQSIYRFNGCDVSYILDFEQYWGPSAICKIEHTYRFSGELLEKSSEFIQRNKRQIRKDLIGKENTNSVLEPVRFKSRWDACTEIGNILDRLPENMSVLFLGRYNHDVVLLDSELFSWKPEVKDGIIKVKYAHRPDLEMQFMTIHSSKGLQADVVFSLNNVMGRYGFPSKMQEPMIIPLLLGNESDRLDEERRLFYVAMTRAKKAAYIVAKEGKESEFFLEEFLIPEDKTITKMMCPICGGNLVLRHGPYGDFYGCSNYSVTGCKFKRKIGFNN